MRLEITSVSTGVDVGTLSEHYHMTVAEELIPISENAYSCLLDILGRALQEVPEELPPQPVRQRKSKAAPVPAQVTAVESEVQQL